MSEFVIRVEGIGDSERIAQLEEIVRCRDCAHARRDGWECMRRVGDPDDDADLAAPVRPDGFCKWGERGEDANA